MSQTGQIQAPQRGEPIRASWAQSITEAVNSMLPFSAPGRLLRAGFGGTGSVPVPENKRNRTSAASAPAPTIPTVYDIVTDESGTNGAARTHFTNRYFEVSGVIREGPDVSGSLTDSAYAEKWIAIQLTGSASGYTQTIVAYSALSVLVELAENQNYVIIPLYKLNSTGGVEIDLRRIPRADMWSVYI